MAVRWKKLPGLACFSFFFKKKPKSLDQFQKKIRIYDLEKFSEERVNVSRFFAYVRDGRETKSELFLEKVRFSLIVCQKKVNILDSWKNLNKGDERLRGSHRDGGVAHLPGWTYPEKF